MSWLLLRLGVKTSVLRGDYSARPNGSARRWTSRSGIRPTSIRRSGCSAALSEETHGRTRRRLVGPHLRGNSSPSPPPYTDQRGDPLGRTSRCFRARRTRGARSGLAQQLHHGQPSFLMTSSASATRLRTMSAAGSSRFTSPTPCPAQCGSGSTSPVIPDVGVDAA